MDAGDIISFDEPKWAKTTGQGNPPKGLTVTVSDASYFFEWGKQLKVSTSCDPEHGIANLDASGDYPLIRKTFAEQYKDQITIHTTNTEEA